jgi:hypothetical protein
MNRNPIPLLSSSLLNPYPRHLTHISKSHQKPFQDPDPASMIPIPQFHFPDIDKSDWPQTFSKPRIDIEMNSNSNS